MKRHGYNIRKNILAISAKRKKAVIGYSRNFIQRIEG